MTGEWHGWVHFQLDEKLSRWKRTADQWGSPIGVKKTLSWTADYQEINGNHEFTHYKVASCFQGLISGVWLPSQKYSWPWARLTAVNEIASSLPVFHTVCKSTGVGIMRAVFKGQLLFLTLLRIGAFPIGISVILKFQLPVPSCKRLCMQPR